MTFCAVCRLLPVVQGYWVLKHGTVLAQRWEADDDRVNLYRCAHEGRGLLGGVGVDEGQQPAALATRQLVAN